ncbi:MAG TPA: glycosyltransferase family 2 protein [Bradyrhizobium sp.]|uniref:glycosyltransferase family 2 protein n=1 Tax=Bradyrhizobium sp. TaxID=376 RepID=UPI002B48DFF4|nr:glycosyltransferase family 2 protein [Bradyrhizobium sp.]HKO70856.1 glycosyltransferase family 2 protein [Bradyrhizobium sp.]
MNSLASNDVIVLVHVYDQDDLLEPFVRWYSELGVRRILAFDLGSTDGTYDILSDLASRYPLIWSQLDDLDIRNYSGSTTGDHLAMYARETYAPEWMLMCDADEFLCVEGCRFDAILDKATAESITALSIPCFNMTGTIPAKGDPSLSSLTTRIVEPYGETFEEQIAGATPVPFIFVKHPVKSIVKSAAFSSYVPGGHGANVEYGRRELVDCLRFNHYPMRSYAKFEKKVSNAAQFLRTNDHLPDWWAWHWRRWVNCEAQGQLEDEYRRQFVSIEEQRSLVADGLCVVDESVSIWYQSLKGLIKPAPKADPLALNTLDGQKLRIAALEAKVKELGRLAKSDASLVYAGNLAASLIALSSSGAPAASGDAVVDDF